MILVPKGNYIQIIDQGKENILHELLSVDTSMVKTGYTKLLIGFNDGTFQQYQGPQKIPTLYREVKEVRIKIRILYGSEFEECYSDPIPITSFAGKKFQDQFPNEFKALEGRVTTLETEFLRLLNHTKTLKQVVQDIYEEGDII